MSSHELILSLISRGHIVAILSRLLARGNIYFFNRLLYIFTRKKAPFDRIMGYPVYRGWGMSNSSLAAYELPEVLRDFRPDIVVAQGGQSLDLAIMARKLDLPAVVYLRDVEFDELKVNPVATQGLTYIANSNFTADCFKTNFGLTARVIPPLVDPDLYRVDSAREVVLFVNPHPKKGVEIALALAAARPDIQFLFQESWELSPNHRKYLEEAIERMPNVTLNAPVHDMRNIYKRARIVLAPSQWQEAWGRIATEAQISGIPILGSNRGGLPEAIGDGGIVVPFDAPIEQWITALAAIWDDPETYLSYSQRALERSQRQDIQVDYLLNEFEALIRAVVEPPII